MQSSPQTENINRQPVVAGRFYSASTETLRKNLEEYFSHAKPFVDNGPLRAIVVPHAGYVYSGQVAASGYNQIPSKHSYKRVFLIGSSHHVQFNGASVYHKGNYLSPLGEVPVDTKLAKDLIANHSAFTFREEAHQSEHSLEVQLPFLQHTLRDEFSLIPIVIAANSTKTCQEIANALKPYFTPENLFIISTDFSHYPDYQNAKEVDAKTAKAIVSNSPDEFLQQIQENKKLRIPNLHTSICGWTSMLTLLYLTENNKSLSYHQIEYKNSGDQSFGDNNQVVGYHAITLNEIREETFRLTDSEKKALLSLARKTLELYARERVSFEPEKSNFQGTLSLSAGAFVTLRKQGDLRGCIGRFNPNQPLFQTIIDMTISAGYYDTRFQPVSVDELDEISIEISVLTPLKKIRSKDDIELGRHGIYIKEGYHTGTFLPQVAAETGWTLEEFLGRCARDKAHIGWDGWKHADLFTYEAIIFHEAN